MKTIIQSFEEGLYPQSKVYCEPQLGKRDLYPNISHSGNLNIPYDKIKTRIDLQSYADGTLNIFEIAKIIGKPLKEINNEYKLLKSHDLL